MADDVAPWLERARSRWCSDDPRVLLQRAQRELEQLEAEVLELERPRMAPVEADR